MFRKSVCVPNGSNWRVCALLSALMSLSVYNLKTSSTTTYSTVPFESFKELASNKRNQKIKKKTLITVIRVDIAPTIIRQIFSHPRLNERKITFFLPPENRIIRPTETEVGINDGKSLSWYFRPLRRRRCLLKYELFKSQWKNCLLL